MKETPVYTTPQGFKCPECGDECEIIPLLNDFGYAGTHCTGGRAGCHYPSNWGQPVTSCCCAPIDDYEYDGEETETSC